MSTMDGKRSADVIVVGAGAAGLSAAAALSRIGVAVLVLERDPAIGGTWARRYDRLHLHTTRGLSGLPYFPIPRLYPQYLSRNDFVKYLQEYAVRARLHVSCGTDVRKIGRRGGHEWSVHSIDGIERRAPVVIVATGQYRDPITPVWPGRTLFAGRLTHSAEYTNGKTYVGQRMLVVGAGNSGAEIATDLADSGAAFVALSVRTTPPVVPRDPFGMPVQRTSLLLSALPAALANRLGRLTARLTLGDLTQYGMASGRFEPYTTRRVPLIDVGFVDALRNGRIQIRPAVDRLTATGAVFADGREESFDSIIAATGFSTGLQTLIDAPEVLDEAGEPRARSGDPTACAGLYFLGFFHSLRGHLFETNRASRRLARHVRRYLDSIAPAPHGSAQ